MRSTTTGSAPRNAHFTAALTVLEMKSRLSCAMCSTEISFGQAASHSLMFVQWPKPSVVRRDHLPHAVLALRLALRQLR